MRNSGLTSSFAKKGEEFLTSLNSTLLSGERAAAEALPSAPQMPVLFVVGAPRSGTTLLTQWLGMIGFGVPTNLAARMPEAPYISGLLQRLLTDPDLKYLDEMKVCEPGFESVVGKTSGLLSAHEYFYFWRRFFALDVARPMTDDERASADLGGFAEGLAALEAGLGRPLALKAILAQYDLDLIAEAVPSSIFLVTRRNEVANVESLLGARRRVSGSEKHWFSVRPAGSDGVEEHHDPVTQAAAQVAWTNDDLTDQFARLRAHRVIEVDHSEFCRDPSRLHETIGVAVMRAGQPWSAYNGPRSFTERRYDDLERSAQINEALKEVRRTIQR